MVEQDWKPKDYIELLELFDRKERGWLIRQCIGGRPALSESFCAAIGMAFGVEAPDTRAWWTIDYHLDWLAAVSRYDYDKLGEIISEDIMRFGNQDIDLIIATPEHLFLIEAKAAGSWLNEQLDSKMTRLKTICPDDGGRLGIRTFSKEVMLHFGIFAMHQERGINTHSWPSWALNNNNKPYMVEPDRPGR